MGNLGSKSKLAALSLVFALGMTGCGGGGGGGDGGGSTPEFTVSDVEGNWTAKAISFALTGNPSGDGTFIGGINFDASGNVFEGYFEDSSGLQLPISSGAVSMQDNGEFNGTIEAAGQFVFDVYSGKMAPSKEIIVWTDTSTDIGSIDLGVAVKEGGTFATSDLQGKWYLFGPSVGADLGSPEGTIWGAFELDENGSVTDANISTSDGLSFSATGGAIAINSEGELNGTITASFGGQNFIVSVDSGKMELSKNIMFMTSETGSPLNSNELITAVKSAVGTEFTTADLEGTWYLHGVSMGSTFGKLTITGNMDVDKDGNITNGVYIATGEETGLQPLPAQILSGEMHFNNDGSIVGSAVASINTGSEEINSTITMQDGRLASTKDVAIMVTDDDLGENAYIIAIKGN